MNLLRHQLAKPRVMKYMSKFRNSNGPATFLPIVAILLVSDCALLLPSHFNTHFESPISIASHAESKFFYETPSLFL